MKNELAVMMNTPPKASDVDETMLNAFAEMFYEMFKEARNNDDERSR